MSELKAMRAIATNPVLAPYISPKRLERVTKCCEHYQDLGYSDVRQTANILKRVHLAETAFENKFLSKHNDQFQRFTPNDPDIIPKANQTDRKALKALMTFEGYALKAKKIIVDSIVTNGGVDY